MWKGGLTIISYRFGNAVIDSAGYDAQCALLEIKFVCDGEIWRYNGVPEDIWYSFKGEARPDVFFHRYIKGYFEEMKVSANGN